MSLDKNEKIGVVSYLIIQEMNKVKKSKINVQKLAEKAQVSRPWIYKYFGSSEKEIVMTAIDCLSSQITELTKEDDEPESRKEWARFFLKSLDITMVEAETYPEFFQFYFMCMLFPSEFTERLKHHEHLYHEHRVIPRIKKVFAFSQTEARSFAEMILALRLGMVISWLREENKTKANRQKLIGSVRKNIFDQFKELD